jgi:hypothetical protein
MPPLVWKMPEFEADVVVIKGGRLKKPEIVPTRVIDDKKYIRLRKSDDWLSLICTGEHKCRAPLKRTKGLEQLQKALYDKAEIVDAGDDPLLAAIGGTMALGQIDTKVKRKTHGMAVKQAVARLPVSFTHPDKGTQEIYVVGTGNAADVYILKESLPGFLTYLREEVRSCGVAPLVGEASASTTEEPPETEFDASSSEGSEKKFSCSWSVKTGACQSRIRGIKTQKLYRFYKTVPKRDIITKSCFSPAAYRQKKEEVEDEAREWWDVHRKM